jgi:hypothetical protein
VDQSITEVRTMSYLLYPPMLEEMGLEMAIGWYLDGFAKRSGVRTSFEMPQPVGRIHPMITRLFARGFAACCRAPGRNEKFAVKRAMESKPSKRSNS